MAKKYVLLNFSDYLSPTDATSIATRQTPQERLKETFRRRVTDNGGEFSLYNLGDFFAHLRLDASRGAPGHPLAGLLDAATIRPLMAEAAKRCPSDWNTLIKSCIAADTIVFSAHGRKGDTDNVYCMDGFDSVRCGDVEGICTLFIALLTPSGKQNPNITLSVCYAARSADHQKHHVNDTLSEGDLRSSLAFQLFVGLSGLKPGTQLRLTARTGATSGSEVGTKLLSETEEAIIASEKLKAEFPDAEAVTRETMDACSAFEESLRKSNVPAGEQQEVRNYLYEWFGDGCDPRELDRIIDAVDELDGRNKGAGLKLLECLCCCCGLDFSWQGRQADAIENLRARVRSYHRMARLQDAAWEKEEKYGKFVYQRQDGWVIVSRWVNGGDGYVLTQLLRLRP
jgi:hypothetical protein